MISSLKRSPIAFAVTAALAFGAVAAVPVAAQDEELTKVTMVLPWVLQGESAGHFVAVEQGYYEEAGLDVTIIPGGPDVDARRLLASGGAQFAVGSTPGIILARNVDIPLVGLWTQNQESGSGLVCKTETGIDSWDDLEGKKVGIWVGLGEPENYYAVEQAGVSKDDVSWLPQKFSMIEFFEDKFDCASVTVWNELHVVTDEGLTMGEDFEFLKASDLGIFLSGDSGFTTQQMIDDNPEIVQAFTDASLRGWKHALDFPEDAVDATMAFAPDLDRQKQVFQVEEVNRLMTSGAAEASGNLGTMTAEAFEANQDALVAAGVLAEAIDLTGAFDSSFLDNVPAEYTEIGDRAALLERIEANLGES
jgi:NitT/TauT family transport system substrate-binding protein